MRHGSHIYAWVTSQKEKVHWHGVDTVLLLFYTKLVMLVTHLNAAHLSPHQKPHKKNSQRGECKGITLPYILPYHFPTIDCIIVKSFKTTSC